MTDVLEMWIVYDSPTDYPGVFVARKWRIVPGDLPMLSSEVITATSLPAMRAALPLGLVNIGRMEADEAQIVEVWT